MYRQLHNLPHCPGSGGFQSTRTTWLAALMALLFSLPAIQTASADGATPAPPVTDVFVMAGYTDEQGFVVEFPAIDPQLLSQQIRDLRAALLSQRAELVTTVEDLEMGTAETLLSILLPGGLIYAGYRTHEYEAAKEDLAEIDTEIHELSRDLANFESRLSDVAVGAVE